MIPALRNINDAIANVEEMPDTPELVSARWLLGQAKARVEVFVQRQERQAETLLPPPGATPAEAYDTEPSPPPSTRAEMPTLPDGGA